MVQNVTDATASSGSIIQFASLSLSGTLDLVSSKMQSLRSISGLALSALGLSHAVMAADFAPFAIDASKSCSSTTLSCHNTTKVTDLCCFNAPGGSLLQTQFWDADSGPSNSWTIHGLWPDNCDGTYQANCDSSRAYTGFSSILNSFGQSSLLSYMNTYWKNDPSDGTDETFWEHE